MMKPEMQKQVKTEKASLSNSPNKKREPAEDDQKKWAMIGIAAAFIFGGWLLLGGSDGDDIIPKEQAEIKQQYQQSTPIQLPALTAAQAMAKIDLLPLKPEAKKQILSDYNGNKVRLVEITLWDNYAEDGDIVEFSIGSFALTVPILHKKKSFVVPLPIGVNTVNVKGIRDGGGGITAAVKTSSGALAFPLMRVGEVIQLPIL